MKRFMFLIALLFLCPMVWADSPQPPIPMPAGDDNSLPPPVDLSTLTPLPLPSNTDSNKANSQADKKQEQFVPTPTSVPPTDTPTVAIQKAKVIASTDTPTKTVPVALVATATPVSKEPEKNPAEETKANSTDVQPSGTPVSAGALTEYFPVVEGSSATYEFLQAGKGQTAKETFTAKYLRAEQMQNGTIRVTVSTNESSGSVTIQYSIYNGKVEKMGEGWTPSGELLFRIPKPGAMSYWTNIEKDGTINKSKAAFGQAQVYQKTYPDCLIVTEKVVKAGKTNNTIIYYYAKGIGLVSRESYSSSLKLIPDQSYALVNGSGANTN